MKIIDPKEDSNKNESQIESGKREMTINRMPEDEVTQIKNEIISDNSDENAVKFKSDDLMKDKKTINSIMKIKCRIKHP
ncbi:26114_t:CDS:2, partial [Racocetra persica]